MKKLIYLAMLMSGVLFLGSLYAAESAGKLKSGKYLDELFATNYNYSGDKNAQIVIYDFFDYNCDDCRAVTPYVEKIAKEDKDVKVVYIDYPKLGDISTYAAKVAIAASLQGKYNEVHNALMDSKKYYKSDDQVLKTIENLGINMKKIKADADSDNVTLMVYKNLLIGTNQSIKYVPTFVIGDIKNPDKATIFSDDNNDGKTIQKEIKKYKKALKLESDKDVKKENEQSKKALKS